MAKTVTERMAVIETRMQGINDTLKDHVEEQREDFKKVLEKLDNLDSKFAGKWVEKGIIVTICSVIAGITLLLIGKI